MNANKLPNGLGTGYLDYRGFDGCDQNYRTDTNKSPFLEADKLPLNDIFMYSLSYNFQPIREQFTGWDWNTSTY